MANIAFTALPSVASATLADIICAVQGGVNVQITQSQVLDLFRDNLILNYAGDPNTNLAGTIYELCFDTSNSDLYICTTSGSSATAVWTRIGAALVDPTMGGTGVSDPTIHTLPVAQGSTAFNFLGPLTNGQLLIGSTGADPVAAALTAGTNISISNAAGSITINSLGSGPFPWTDVMGTSQNMSVENGYIANNAGLVTLTLPTTSVVGDQISVVGNGAGGWSIAQNASQIIHVGSSATTAGVTGSVSSTNRYDSINLICTVANTEWVTRGGVQGTLTIA